MDEILPLHNSTCNCNCQVVLGILYIFYIWNIEYTLEYRIYTGYESKGAFIFEPLFLATRYFALSRRFLNILGLPRTMSFAIKMPTS